MAEPAQTILTGVAPAAAATGLGMLLGMHADALLIGFMAGLVALMHVPPKPGARTPLRVFALVAGSAFLSGIFAPLVAAATVNYFQWAAAVGSDSLRFAAAAAIGGGVHLPIVRKRFFNGEGQ